MLLAACLTALNYKWSGTFGVMKSESYLHVWLQELIQ